MSGNTVAIAVLIGALLLIALAFVIVQSVIGIILAIVVALVAGIIGERVTGGSTGGALQTVLCGFAGAVVGITIAELANLPRLISIGGLPLIWTIIGSIITVAVWSAIRKQTDEGTESR